MTCSILRSQPCWFAYSAGTGNSSQHSLPNSCRESIESIWFRFWTFAVMNVYRKWKQVVATDDKTHDQPSVIEGEYKSSS
jgi:hypothetical protein